MRISDWSSDVCSSDLRKAQSHRFLRLLGYLRSAHPQPGEDRSDAEQSRGDRHPIPGKGGEDEGAADEDRRDHRDEARTRHTQALDRLGIDGRGDHGLALALFRRGQEEAPFVDVAYRSEEHTSELQSLMRISYAVF